MTKEGKKYLYDILYAIEHIDNFMDDIANYEQYANDIKTKSAVERQLAIIGEAVNKYRKLDLDFELTHSHRIISVRNRLIHSYDNIDDSIIWVILDQHIPVLHEEVKRGLIL